jgi:hypothetical protein
MLNQGSTAHRVSESHPPLVDRRAFPFSSVDSALASVGLGTPSATALFYCPFKEGEVP